MGSGDGDNSIEGGDDGVSKELSYREVPDTYADDRFDYEDDVQTGVAEGDDADDVVQDSLPDAIYCAGGVGWDRGQDRDVAEGADEGRYTNGDETRDRMDVVPDGGDGTEAGAEEVAKAHDVEEPPIESVDGGETETEGEDDDGAETEGEEDWVNSYCSQHDGRGGASSSQRGDNNINSISAPAKEASEPQMDFDSAINEDNDRYTESLPETCSYYVDQIEGFLESIAKMKGGADGLHS